MSHVSINLSRKKGISTAREEGIQDRRRRIRCLHCGALVKRDQLSCVIASWWNVDVPVSDPLRGIKMRVHWDRSWGSKMWRRGGFHFWLMEWLDATIKDWEYCHFLACFRCLSLEHAARKNYFYTCKLTTGLMWQKCFQLIHLYIVHSFKLWMWSEFGSTPSIT